MSKVLEQRLTNLINEAREIKKELFLNRIEQKDSQSYAKIERWNELKEKVTSKWDNLSVYEELKFQREKL